MTRIAVAMFALLFAGSAHAGGGPWVLAKGDQSLYAGLEAQRFARIAINDGNKSTPDDLGEGLSSLTAVGVLTYGVAQRVEFELTVPWQTVTMNRTDTEPCTTLGADSCKTTQGIGVISVKGKLGLADEVNGAPLTFALGGELRYGGLTAETRSRLTNLGEGTTDLGGFASVARSGGLGQGYWSAFLTGWGRYRMPITDSYPIARPNQNARIPGEEYGVLSELYLAPKQAAAVGPAVEYFTRPRGVDFPTTDMTDVDRFTALRVASLRVGAKLIVRDEKNTAFVVSAFRTVWARNNPTDSLGISAGVTINGLFDRRD